MQCSKQGIFGFGVLDFPDLEFILAPVCFGFGASDFGFDFVWLRFVSNFDIRISDLPLRGLFRSAGPLSKFGFRIFIRWGSLPLFPLLPPVQIRNPQTQGFIAFLFEALLGFL
jgi:hypothetical protein